MRFLTRGILTLACSFILAGSLAAQNRLSGDYANKIRPERLVTPCRPFAADYAKGPVKALFFVNGGRAAGREVAELKQRFPMEIASIVYNGGDAKLSNDDFWGAPVEGSFTSEILQVLYGHLEKKWDVFVFGGVSFDALSSRAKYEILKQVSEGAALIGVGGNSLPKTILANPAQADSRQILAGVPFPTLPCYTNLNKGAAIPMDQVPPGLLTTYSFGKGRIAVLSHVLRYEYQSLTPSIPYTYSEQTYYDHYLSLFAKIMLWAVPSKASDIVPVMGGTPAAFGVDWASLPQPLLCGTFTVPSIRGLTCKVELRDLFGGVIPLTAPAVESGTYALIVTVPELPRGDYFIDYRFVSKKGTEYWGSYGLTVKNAPATVREIVCAKPRFARTDAFKARIALEPSTATHLTVRIQGIDDQDRVVFQKSFSTNSAAFNFDAELTRCLVMPHHLRVELWNDKRCLDVARQEFLVQRPDPLYANIVWGAGGWTIMGQLEADQIRKAGFNVSLGYATPESIAQQDMLFLPYFANVQVPEQPKSTNELDWGFCNPEWAKSYVTNVQARVRAYAGLEPYYFSLGDENGYSYTRGKVAPSELRAWRQLLRDTYGDKIDALNREWSANYANFENIEIPNVQAKLGMADIPRKHLWMHFCEKLYADAHHIIANAIRQVEPKARVGAEGSGGGDMELTLDGLEMWGPYPSRLDNVLMRSLGPQDLLRGNWWGGYVSSRRAKADGYWEQLLSGGVNSCFYYCTVGWEGLFSCDLSYADFFEQDQLPSIKEIAAGIGPLLNRTPYAKMGVGIVYSMPSAHALSIDTRFGAPGSSRDGLLKFCEDNGISSFLYSEKQILAGKLQKDQVRILFVPQIICISDAAAEALTKWVMAGGTLVADQQTGLRNERAAIRAQGALDALFGVRQDMQGEAVLTNCAGQVWGSPVTWDRVIVDAKVTTTNPAAMLLDGRIPLIVSRSAGKGKTVFLNLSLGKVLSNYGGDAATRTAMLSLLDQAGVFTKLQAPAGYLVSRFQGKGYELLSCRISAEGKEGEKLILGQPYHVYDIRAAKYLGNIGELVPSACSGKHNLFALLPAQAPDMAVAFPKTIDPGAVADVTITVAAAPAGSSTNAPERFYRVEVFSPDNREIEAMRSFAAGADAPVTVKLPFALNQAKGRYTLEVADILTGMKKTVPFEVKGDQP